MRKYFKFKDQNSEYCRILGYDWLYLCIFGLRLQTNSIKTLNMTTFCRQCTWYYHNCCPYVPMNPEPLTILWLFAWGNPSRQGNTVHKNLRCFSQTDDQKILKSARFLGTFKWAVTILSLLWASRFKVSVEFVTYTKTLPNATNYQHLMIVQHFNFGQKCLNFKFWSITSQQG